MTTITTSSRWRLPLIVVAIALGMFAAATERVGAHAEYDRSSPAPDSVVRAPARVEIWFTQELFRRAGANTIAITGADGPVDTGPTVLDDGDRNHLSLELGEALPPGEYIVSWTSLSAIDGDTAEGTFAFTVDPSAPAATVVPTDATPATEVGTSVPPSIVDSESGSASWIIAAAFTVFATAVLGVWALRFAGTDPGAVR